MDFINGSVVAEFKHSYVFNRAVNMSSRATPIYSTDIGTLHTHTRMKPHGCKRASLAACATRASDGTGVSEKHVEQGDESRAPTGSRWQWMLVYEEK